MGYQQTYLQTTPFTVTTNAETSLVTGDNVISAGIFFVTTCFIIRVIGNYTAVDDGSGVPPTIKIKIKIGTAATNEVIVSLDSQCQYGTNTFECIGNAVCYSQGSGGRMKATGSHIGFKDSAKMYDMDGTFSAIIDTTIENTIDVTCEFGSATNPTSLTVDKIFVNLIT